MIPAAAASKPDLAAKALLRALPDMSLEEAEERVVVIFSTYAMSLVDWETRIGRIGYFMLIFYIPEYVLYPS